MYKQSLENQRVSTKKRRAPLTIRFAELMLEPISIEELKDMARVIVWGSAIYFGLIEPAILRALQ